MDIKYPRNQFVRKGYQVFGKAVSRLLTRAEIKGMENYPKTGSLIVVGNHTGVMETVLMTSFAPRPIEYMGSVDIPHEKSFVVFMESYKYIPVYRGNVSRAAMQAGVSVLKQGGVIGIFPEGGIWEPAIRNAHTGVAFLSYHAQAPILPIGFSATSGALGKALKLQRPHLKMNIGKPIPPVQIKPGIPKKVQYQEAAQAIMDTVWNLMPQEDTQPHEQIQEENFELQVTITDNAGHVVDIPSELTLENGPSFSKILYRTTLINNFRENLGLNIKPLKNLNRNPKPAEFVASTSQILDYLENDNPYYFTYRYGIKEGTAMGNSIQQFHDLAQWANENNYNMSSLAIRKYKINSGTEEIIETHPTELKKW
ncbi:MAG TPA: lysophospholipid acyltransferase family protein [Anaerolineales bacterium]|nr:lysophospholipid acyltransferase family protein [Anaerolineales bacterium]